ncbi:BTAD domain-containing putative transcriptional regulator, partial [Salipiger mangrovisoli]|nr:hypothetical protein [Salipiger mangrovisoli]
MSISLLGDCRITPSASDPVASLGQKEQGLLAVLALASGTPIPRERLAALLWSDRDELHARDSLKHALGHLREVLGSARDALCSDRQSAHLDPGAVDIDALAFERHCAEGSEAAAERALALYRGALLEGCAVRDPAFEDWLATERRRFGRLAEQAAGRVMASALETGNADRALVAAYRLEAMDPLREDACRTIMTCLARNGDRCGALRRFETLRAALRDELGVAPEPQTLAVLDEVSKHPLRQADPATPLHTPARPSIAVLAFDVSGTDPEQAYFADGVVEEIIGALSRVRWLFVISRSSSFAWRGEQEDVTRIGQTLGVRYILSGSVRRGGDRMRIAGRLVDAASGGLLWAETFEGGLENVFDLQDRVTARVVGAVAPRLEQAEIERAR